MADDLLSLFNIFDDEYAACNHVHLPRVNPFDSNNNQTLFLHFITNFIHRFAIVPDCC